MHWIQKSILKKLSSRVDAKYSELKPEGVDGNLFMYHLNKLIGEKYVEKNSSRYQLTKAGKKYVGGISLESGNPLQTPRLFTIVYARNKKGEVLLFKWSRQPYIGHTSLPLSRVRYGRPITESVESTIKHKTGLSANYAFLGSVNVVVSKKGDISTHYLGLVYELEPNGFDASSDNYIGRPFWVNEKTLPECNLIDGMAEVINIIKSKKPPFNEEVSLDL